jgi:hypothetical protein
MRSCCGISLSDQRVASRLIGLLVPFICLFLIVDPSSAQHPTPTGTIRVRITCGDNAASARYVHVTLVPVSSQVEGETSNHAQLESTTDGSGNVLFNNVPVGMYFVDASLAGYLRPLRLLSDTALRSSDPEVRKLVFDRVPNVTLDSSGSADVAFALERGAAISGKVSYDDGVPIESIGVRVTRVQDSDQADGRGSIYSKAFEAQAMTDDRGMYRIAGLPAGTYIASARITMNHLQVHVVAKDNVTMSAAQSGDVNLTFYAPSAIQRVKAQVFKLGQQDERQGVDLVADLSHLHSIGGFVQAQGRAVPGAGLELRGDVDPENRHGTITDETGSFRFDLLPEGPYKLIVYVGVGQPKPSVSVQVIVTNTDALDLTIDTQKVSR